MAELIEDFDDTNYVVSINFGNWTRSASGGRSGGCMTCTADFSNDQYARVTVPSGATQARFWYRMNNVGELWVYRQAETYLFDVGGATDWTQSQVIDLSGVTELQFLVASSDFNSDGTVWIDDLTFEVPGGDEEPPTAPTNLAATSVTTDSVTLTWDPSTDNEGVAGYEVYRDSSLVTTVTGTTYTDSNLNPSTTYTYKVRAKDEAENYSDFSDEIQVTTLADVDEEAPTAPSNLTVTGHTWNSVSLAWDPSTDNVGVVGYEVYRDDALVETVGYTSYTDTGLMPETSYVYKVRAKDAAGNVSEFSDEVTVATNPIPEPGDGGAAVDPSSPPMVAVRRTETISTEPFTAPADSLLVVMHGSDYYQAGAVLSNSGDPLDWDHVVSSTGSEYNGVADIWAAPVPQTRELTVTLTVPDDYPGHGLKVFVVTGADTSNPIGATAQGEAGGQSQYNLSLYTSTAPNSLAMAVVSDFYREFDSLPSVGSGWIGVPWDSENQSGVAAYAASVTSTPGTPVQMTYTAANEIASAIHWAVIEILPGESTEPPTPTLVVHGWGPVPIARIK